MAAAALRNNNTATDKPAPSAGTSRQADSVSLSDSARALSSAAKSVGNTSDVREDRIAALKAASANGTYSVNSHALARKMVDTALR
jgi:negative regulator of flagellin synthesis FlgM